MTGAGALVALGGDVAVAGPPPRRRLGGADRRRSRRAAREPRPRRRALVRRARDLWHGRPALADRQRRRTPRPRPALGTAGAVAVWSHVSVAAATLRDANIAVDRCGRPRRSGTCVARREGPAAPRGPARRIGRTCRRLARGGVTPHDRRGGLPSGKTFWFVTRGPRRWRPAAADRFGRPRRSDDGALAHRCAGHGLSLPACTGTSRCSRSCFVVVHVLTTLLDGYTSIGLKDAVIPFFSSYRPVWLGLGAIAFDLLLILVATSLLRERIGYRLWRYVHWLAYASWPIALVHALGTGQRRARGLAAPGRGGLRRRGDARSACAIRARGRDCRAARASRATSPRSPRRSRSLRWYQSGPARPGWAKPCGHAHLAARGQASRRAVASSIRQLVSVALPRSPFSASLSGTCTRRTAAHGLVDVVIRGGLHGGAGGSVRIDLRGAGAARRRLDDGERRVLRSRRNPNRLPRAGHGARRPARARERGRSRGRAHSACVRAGRSTRPATSSPDPWTPHPEARDGVSGARCGAGDCGHDCLPAFALTAVRHSSRSISRSTAPLDRTGRDLDPGGAGKWAARARAVVASRAATSSRAVASGARPRMIVVNATEGEPASKKDRALVATRPSPRA